MKKLIAIAVVFALVAGVAFADDGKVNEGITVGGSAEARFVPFNFGGPTYTGTGGINPDIPFGSWKDGTYETKPDEKGRSELFTGIHGFRVRLNVSGSSDYAGFTFNIRADREARNAGTGNNLATYTFIIRNDANFWVQPFGSPVLRVSYGNGGNAGLGGSNGEDFGSMSFTDFTVKHDYRNAGGNGNIFTGFADSGVVIDSVGLVENLKFGIAVPGINVHSFGETFAPKWKDIQIAAGYQIPDVGLVRFGYFGGWAEPIDLTA